jgi:hypothetical protein
MKELLVGIDQEVKYMQPAEYVTKVTKLRQPTETCGLRTSFRPTNLLNVEVSQELPSDASDGEIHWTHGSDGHSSSVQ